MDSDNRESAVDVSNTPAGIAEAAAGTRSTISEKATDAKDTLNKLGQRAVDKLNDSREPAAQKLENASATLHSGTDRMSDLGHSAADRIHAGADYLREADLQTIGGDLQNLIRRYPVQTLAVGAILAFLVTRALRRSD